MRRRTFARRPRTIRKGNWAGVTNASTPNFASGTDIHAVSLWDPVASSSLNLAGIGSIKRIVLDLCIKSGTSVPNPYFGWYLQVFPTDDGYTTPSDIIFNPIDTDVDSLEKRIIAFGSLFIEQPNTNDPGIANLHIDLKPRGHRLTNEDQLLLVFCGGSGSGTGNVVNVRGRTYVSW